MSVRRQDRSRSDYDHRYDCDQRDRGRERDHDGDQAIRRRRSDDDKPRSRRKRSHSRSLEVQRKPVSRSRLSTVERRCLSSSRSVPRRRRRRSCSRSLQIDRRRRRSRSRSWSEYQRRRDASRERQKAEELLAREKAREARREERAANEPSEIILLHGIPDTGVAEDQLESAAWNHAIQAGCSMPDAVSFSYDKSTQEFSGSGTIEFPHKEAAKLFKDHSNGLLEVEGFKLTLKYHHTTEPSRSPERFDPRGHDEATVTIFVKGLATSTSEAAVVDSFQPFATVKHIRHFQRRGFAFVQFHSVEEAALALQRFEGEMRNMIDGQRVVANFAKEREDGRFAGADRGFLGNQVQNQVALQALAIADAEGDKLLARMEHQQAQQENTEKALTGVNADMWASYMQSFAQTETVQSTNTFKHDPKSGFYLDEKAGLYYDPNSTYFFTMDYKKYFVYDHEAEMLCEVNSEGNKVPKGERRPLPSQGTKGRDRENGANRGAQQRVRSRSRGSPRRPRSRSCKKLTRAHAAVVDSKKAAKQVASEWGFRHGEFRPIYFAGGDPLACLAPAPSVTPKAEVKKKKKPQQDVLGLAPMPHVESLNTPGHVTVLSGPKPGPVQLSGPRPGPVQMFHRSSPIADYQFSLESRPSTNTFSPDLDPSDAAVQPSASVMPDEWICEVCMRKFSSEEMLRKHELMSDLHKQNLAKLRGDV